MRKNFFSKSRRGGSLKKYFKAKAKHIRLGRIGENAACELLKSKNMTIICRNYKCRHGEIDIIARDGLTLCFIEVKTRRASAKYRPARGLTLRQMKRIYRSGLYYMKKLKNPRTVYRFDLIELRHNGFDFIEARHWYSHFGRDTFRPSETAETVR